MYFKNISLLSAGTSSNKYRILGHLFGKIDVAHERIKCSQSECFTIKGSYSLYKVSEL